MIPKGSKRQKVESSLEDRTQPTNEPSEAQHRRDAHADRRAQRPSVLLARGRAARGAHPLVQGRVRGRLVQAELVAHKRLEVARRGSLVDGPVRVLDDEVVVVGAERAGGVGRLVRLGVPRVGAARGMKRHVGRQGPGHRDRGPRDHHVDGRRGAQKIGVVPAPGDIVADLMEEGAPLRRRGRQHHHVSGGQALVEDLALRCGRSGAVPGVCAAGLGLVRGTGGVHAGAGRCCCVEIPPRGGGGPSRRAFFCFFVIVVVVGVSCRRGGWCWGGFCNEKRISD